MADLDIVKDTTQILLISKFGFMKIQPSHISELTALTELAKTTFLQSHGHCASEEEVASYVNENFTEVNFEKELGDANNVYHSLYLHDELVGYSKINLNYPFKAVTDASCAKMERLYLLDKTHGTGLGKAFFDFNIELTKAHQQSGVWLFVWVENHRAIRFYEKQGFEIVGEHDFRISDRHYNPNHQMLLKF